MNVYISLMCAGTTNEVAYITSLHDVSATFIYTGQPLPEDPGNKTLIWSTLGFIAMDPVG